MLLDLHVHVRSLVDRFLPQLRVRDAMAHRSAHLMDLDCCAKWHLVSRYRRTTLISFTELQWQCRDMSKQIYPREIYYIAVLRNLLSLSLLGASTTRRASRSGWFVGKDRGNTLTLKLSLPRTRSQQFSLKSHGIFEAISIKMLRTQTGIFW